MLTKCSAREEQESSHTPRAFQLVLNGNIGPLTPEQLLSNPEFSRRSPLVLSVVLAPVTGKGQLSQEPTRAGRLLGVGIRMPQNRMHVRLRISVLS